MVSMESTMICPDSIHGEMCIRDRTQTKDQDGVENNVDDRTDDGGKHTGLGKALRGDEGVHAQHQRCV